MIVEGAGLVEIAIAQPGETAWLPAHYAAPRPGDVVQMLPGRRDWRTRRHGSASLWTRLPLAMEQRHEPGSTHH
jgi:hypothetical protein